MEPQHLEPARHPGPGRQNQPLLLVQEYLFPRSAMAPSLRQAPENWPQLDSYLLIASRSKQVCLTCRSFRHHLGEAEIPLLTCQFHQGLIGQGEHLTRRCPNWAGESTGKRGWAPEAA